MDVLWESARKIYCHSKSRVRGLNVDLSGFIEGWFDTPLGDLARVSE